MEKTLIIIKPDSVQNKNVGKIISIFEEASFTIEQIKILIPDETILLKHYHEHIGKSFYQELIDFMKSDRVVVMVISKNNAVSEAREIIGNTNPLIAEKGTVRQLFGTNVTRNAIHASANIIDAQREINIWF